MFIVSCFLAPSCPILVSLILSDDNCVKYGMIIIWNLCSAPDSCLNKLCCLSYLLVYVCIFVIHCVYIHIGLLFLIKLCGSLLVSIQDVQSSTQGYYEGETSRDASGPAGWHIIHMGLAATRWLQTTIMWISLWIYVGLCC